MGEGHFQNEGRAILSCTMLRNLRMYAPLGALLYTSFPWFGEYQKNTILFRLFFFFPPLIRGYLQHFFLGVFLGLDDYHTMSLPRVPFLWPTAEWKPKKNSIRNGWAYPLIFGYRVSSPSCSHHWFECRSPTLFPSFSIACKLQLLFRLPLQREKKNTL
jgi:hypothetical protein